MPFVGALPDCGRAELAAIVSPGLAVPDRVCRGAESEVQPALPANAGGITMRKLLLASAAMLGATAGIASAQTPSMAFQPSQGMMVGPSAANSVDNTSNHANGQPN